MTTKMDRMRTRSLIVLAAWLLAGAGAARSETLDALVKNDSGEPVQDAVVYAIPLDEDGEPISRTSDTVIDQVDKEYVPYVTPVSVGTAISFPNHDRIRHHVYSFSDAKTFEIPLYSGTPREPVVFDRPGPVTLGCNIHDWMMAYVFVSEAPYFALTASDGTATLPDLPSGDYAVRVWHPRIKGEPESTSQRTSVGAGAAPSLTFTIQQKRVWRPRRAPSAGGEAGYR